MTKNGDIGDVISKYSDSELRRLIANASSQRELAKQLGISEYILRRISNTLGIVRQQGRPQNSFKYWKKQIDDKDILIDDTSIY